MIQIIQQNIDNICLLAKQHCLEQLFVFGSAVNGEFDDESDIDFLYTFDLKKLPIEDYADAYFDLLFSLKSLLNREIDLVSEHHLRNKFFISEVNKTKVLLYESKN